MTAHQQAPNEEQVEELFIHAQAREEEWRNELYVQIGRAASLLELKESTIRYIEALAHDRYHLEIGRTLDRNRAYSLDDLSNLWVLGQMIDRWQLKPSEALQRFDQALKMRRQNASPLERDVVTEQTMLVDGFVLSRICHFLLRLLETPPSDQNSTQATPRIVALLFPPVEQQARIASNSEHIDMRLDNVLVCARSELFKKEQGTKTSFWSEIEDDEILSDHNSTVTFIQDTDWSFPKDKGLTIQVVHGGHAPNLRPVLAVIHSAQFSPVPVRRTTFEVIDYQRPLCVGLIQLITVIANKFQPKRDTSSLRFHSDDLPPTLLHQQLQPLLQLFTEVALDLPSDHQNSPGFAVLLTPDSLHAPKRLRVAADWNYDRKFAEVVELRLGDILGDGSKQASRSRGARLESTQPEGLSGYAYHNREVAFSSDPLHDSRIVGAEKEQATSAIAIPLLLDRHMYPYGVLYVVSQDDIHRLEPGRSLLLQLAADILAELLSRIWAKLMRHWNEECLLLNTNNLRWLAALDREEYQRFVWDLMKEGDTWLNLDSAKLESYERGITIVVIDIFQSRQLSDDTKFPLLIPRALKRLEEVWKKVVESVEVPERTVKFDPAWFRGDHLLLAITNQTDEEYQRLVTLLDRLLQANEKYPLEATNGKQQRVTFIATAAATHLTAQQFVDRTWLQSTDDKTEEATEQVFQELVEQLRKEAGSIIPDNGSRVYIIK